MYLLFLNECIFSSGSISCRFFLLVLIPVLFLVEFWVLFPVQLNFQDFSGSVFGRERKRERDSEPEEEYLVADPRKVWKRNVIRDEDGRWGWSERETEGNLPTCFLSSYFFLLSILLPLTRFCLERDRRQKEKKTWVSNVWPVGKKPLLPLERKRGRKFLSEKERGREGEEEWDRELEWVFVWIVSLSLEKFETGREWEGDESEWRRGRKY